MTRRLLCIVITVLSCPHRSRAWGALVCNWNESDNLFNYCVYTYTTYIFFCRSKRVHIQARAKPDSVHAVQCKLNIVSTQPLCELAGHSSVPRLCIPYTELHLLHCIAKHEQRDLFYCFFQLPTCCVHLNPVPLFYFIFTKLQERTYKTISIQYVT